MDMSEIPFGLIFDNRVSICANLAVGFDEYIIERRRLVRSHKFQLDIFW